MRTCHRCHRLVRRVEARCPICGVELLDAPAPVAIAALGLGVAMLLACGPTKPQTTEGGSSGTTTTTTSSTEASAPTIGTPTSTSSTGPCDTACSTSDYPSGFITGHDFDNGGTIKCDVYKQDCAPGEKCTVWADDGGGNWNATKCVPVTGDKVPGDICTAEGSGVSGIDNCEAGTMCWNVDVNNMNMGHCVAFCTGTPDAPICDGALSCHIFGDSVLNLCLSVCDPLLQDCPGDELCLIIDGSVKCVEASGDMAKINEPCDLPNACDPGLVCINTASASSACMQGSQGCCQPYCDLTKMDPCPNPDQTCVQWFDPMLPIPSGFKDVGVCAIPI